MEAQKRPRDDSTAIVAKRARNEIVEARTAMAVVVAQKEARTSRLKAPIMQLSGHTETLTGCEFDPKGERLATAGFDRRIFLWNVYGDAENYAVLEGHKNAILDVHWSADSSQLFTASADKTVCAWDAETQTRVKKFTGHDSFVNACAVSTKGSQMVASVSDDSTCKLWDVRVKDAVKTIANRYQQLAIALSDTADRIYYAGLDNEVKVWDVRKDAEVYALVGHGDSVTGLALSPDGSYLLSNGMDSALHCWDVRPFVAGHRLVKSFRGASHGFEKNLLRCAWAPGGTRVSCGSADRLVYVWDFADARLVYRLPGHQGSVNSVVFHPMEPIIASCSSDKTVYMGEIEAA